MRALITRPIDDAEQVASALEARGIEPIFEPLLAITPTPGATLDLTGVQALLVTSRNGVRVLAEVTPARDIPLYAVGDATAQVARDLGFKTVESAGGDAEALAKLVVAKLDPKSGPLVHAAGHAVAGDLSGRLTEHGFMVRREVLYQAKPATVLSDSTRDLLASGTLDFALFFSPRTAQTFVALVTDAGLTDKCGQIAAVCLSSAIASRLAAISWRTVATAERPDLQALLAAIDGLRQNAGGDAASAPATDGPERDASVAMAPQASAGPRGSPWRANARPKRPLRLWALAGALGVLVVAILGWPLWRGIAPQSVREWLSPGASSPARSDLAARALEDRLSALERRPSQPSAPPRDADPLLERRLAQLESRVTEAPPARSGAAPDEDIAKRLAQLESRVGPVDTSDLSTRLSAADAALRAENERLAGRLAELERRLAAVQEKAAQSTRDGGRRIDAHVLASVQLRDAVSRGGPFEHELAALAALVKDDAGYAEAISLLRTHAERGVVSKHELARRFAPAAAMAARAALAPDGADWLSRTLARLSSVVTIRRIGEDVAGDKPDAMIARAEARLQADDIAGAVAALEGLAGPPAAALAAWLADARATLAVERGLALVSRRALAAATASN